MKKDNGYLNTILKAILPSGTNGLNSDLSTQNNETVDVSILRTEILAYVNRLRLYVSDDWKSRYSKMWGDILDIEIVSQYIYEPGKQQGTNYNRNLVGNIIHFLYSQKVFKDGYKANEMALALEGDKDHSVRAALGKDPDKAITSRLKRYFE